MSIFDDESDIPDEEGDDFSGYTVYDEDELYRRKILAAALEQEEEETIATPIPENEQKVIVDNADFLGLNEGDKLGLAIKENSGFVTYNGSKIADLKPAFVAKLVSARKGNHAYITLYTFDPPMVKFEFSLKGDKEFDVLI